MPVNEFTTFGENSASCVVIISASSNKIGTIVHTNDEIENILGYSRKSVLGKNISIIMPHLISNAHD